LDRFQDVEAAAEGGVGFIAIAHRLVNLSEHAMSRALV
jgi:hypothetical protein